MRGPILYVLTVAFFLVPLAPTLAATLYLDPSDTALNRGDTASVAVRLDTDEGECINTIDATINYSANLEPVDTSRGSSIMSMWVEDPTINKSERTITFAGGIPNGYCGRIAGDPRLTNVIVELLFRSPGMMVGALSDIDEASISFGEETRVLLNDGFGTDAELTTYGSTLRLLKEAGGSIKNQWSERIAQDTISPQEFGITLERNNSAFSGQYYIVFNTTDKQSGIDHYEVIEEPLEEQWLFKWGASNAPWVRARSPYVLDDQSLNSTIRVKAIDKAGNEYIATLIPDESQRSMSTQSKIMLALIVAAIIFFVLAGVIAWLLYRRRTKRQLEETEETFYVDDDHIEKNNSLHEDQNETQ